MPEQPDPAEADMPSRRRRRRWSTEAKLAIVQESVAPGASVSRVARDHGIAPNQLFTWRRRYGDAARRQVAEAEATVPVSSYQALERQFYHLEWLLGKRTLEIEMLRRALELAETTLRRHHLALPSDDEL